MIVPPSATTNIGIRVGDKLSQMIVPPSATTNINIRVSDNWPQMTVLSRAATTNGNTWCKV